MKIYNFKSYLILGCKAIDQKYYNSPKTNIKFKSMISIKKELYMTIEGDRRSRDLAAN